MFSYFKSLSKGKGKRASVVQQDGAATPKRSSTSKPSASQDGKDISPLQDASQIDILFLQDTTGSQGPYIEAAKSAIKSICKKITASTSIAPEAIRFGLIAFRDHPPQDNTALAEGLNMGWEENATKMVVLITDAPPHGIGEAGDGFDASPDQNDPLDIARQMAERGITLFVVACEPELSGYRNAVDFYTALTEITGGKMFPLTMADRLGDYIAGTAVETIETEKLISEYKASIVEDVYGQSRPLEEVMEEVHNKLKERGVKMNKMEVENVYNTSATTEDNVANWKKAVRVGDGKGKVADVDYPRMQEEYSSGARAPTVALTEGTVEYAQAKRVVMQSVMRSSKVTASGMVKR
ncbi:hypothetical protein NLJ89_g9277 [Agrocybe chaxingu]|uniref:VWFA domain-containing protein n=1 Tax=Agrocybe chaxingu TaxID=84603 RepID=A0A9W8K0W4_9AGAR|nr:hypothetical protein NLJ89_g9277 [Agrocybe chaxingu]